MKNFLSVLLAFMTMYFISAVFAAENPLPNLFTSKAYHYSIRYPAAWKMRERDDGVVVFAAQDAKLKKIFTINIQTIYTKQGGGKYKSIKDLMDDFGTQVPMHTEDAKFLDRNSFALSEPDGSTLSGEQTTLTFKENGQTYKQWQVMLINHDGNLFQAWAYRAPITVFDANRQLAASMLASWVID